MFQIHYKDNHILAISDTHGHHQKLQIPECDIIIHCGDACTDGNETQLKDFFKWFSDLPVSKKIFIAGNHDLIFDLSIQRTNELIEQLLAIPGDELSCPPLRALRYVKIL